MAGLPLVGTRSANVSLAFALLGAALIPALLIVRVLQVDPVHLNCCRPGLEPVNFDVYVAVLYLLCMSPSIAAIVTGSIALSRKGRAFLAPGLFLLTLLGTLVVSFLPSSPDGGVAFWSFVIYMCVGIAYAPLFAAVMLFLEARRDYRLARARERVPGEIAAVSGVLLGWLLSGITGWFVLIVAFQFPIKVALVTFGGLFLLNSPVLVSLFLRYELGRLPAVVFNHVVGRQQTGDQ